MAEPLSDERLAEMRAVDAGWGAKFPTHDVYGQRRELLAEVDRLRAALDFAERAAADRLGEDERWLAGWKAAREKAAALAYGLEMGGKATYWAGPNVVRLARSIEEMQP
jgi:hypothetical protein